MEKNVCKMTDDSIFLIDIEKILKTKAGKKYKYIPRFVVSYLKHIVHQDELNVFFKRLQKIKSELTFWKLVWSSWMQKWR